MDCIEALMGRRSCRSFKSDPVEHNKLEKILQCAIFAPSPANKQPWEFIVTANPEYNLKLKESSEKAKVYLAERSGWKWLPPFKIDFVIQAPVLIVVVGDPAKNGAEQFLNSPGEGYVQACAAAIHNICLAAHSLGLATLWYSLYEKEDVRNIFGIADTKDPVSIVCLGYAAQEATAPPRKSLADKVTFLS